MTKEEAIKVVTGDDGYIIEVSSLEEATKDTLEELSNGKGEDDE